MKFPGFQNSRRAVFSCVLALSLGALLVHSGEAIAQVRRYEDSHVSMACAYSIVAYGPDENRLASAANAAFEEIDRIDRLMSNYKPDSPLSRVNREAAARP